MLTTFMNTLMSAEADAVCGASDGRGAIPIEIIAMNRRP
jgi:hypothetical protein